MQHDDVLKKLNFDLLTPFPGLVMGVSRGLGQNICYHVASFLILFPRVMGEGGMSVGKIIVPCGMLEGLDGGVWYSLFIKN